MRAAVTILCLLALAACREWPEPVFTETEALPNVTIGDLRAYYNGEAELTIADEIELSGRVVSSDRAGNFYNTFFIDDGTGALEVMAGMPDLDAVYHPGQRVSIRARGLAVGWRDGVMQLGLPPEAGNRFPTGYFYHGAVIRRWVTAERSVEPVAPIVVSAGGLDISMCGRLVRIEGLAADNATGTWATPTPVPTVGYVKFRAAPTDARPADSITVVTSGYASFAGAPVPRGRVALTGILLHGRGEGPRDHYLLKLRDEEDIDF
ncbi:MAG: DUF5689 domain-containing protein [Alistipes sp.]|jgi:hypothetical protein|nr:DUF5689 domain-containing protein [Alistipes sp.]